jgi:hypothetical protein
LMPATSVGGGAGAFFAGGGGGGVCAQTLAIRRRPEQTDFDTMTNIL